jgi:signal transduction histidine kinase
MDERLNHPNNHFDPDYSREILGLVTDSLGIDTWYWDLQSNTIYHSPSQQTLQVYDGSLFKQTFETWLDDIHPDDREVLKSTLIQHMAQGTPFNIRYRVVGQDQSYQWIWMSGKIIERTDDNQPLKMVGVQRNIHGQVYVEEALRQSEQRHRNITQAISDYAYSYIVHADGTLEKDWSTQAVRACVAKAYDQYTPEGWEQSFHADDLGIASERYHQLLNNQAHVCEFRVVQSDGGICWLQDHAHPIYDERLGRVVHIYGAAQDITERKYFEQQLQEQANELRARNEELDAFAYTVAHDLKNPIASMMGFASLVQKYYTRMTEDKVMEYLDLIMESGYKLKDIINALLLLAGVSKIESPQLAPLDMPAIIDNTLPRLTTLIKERNAILTLPDEWPQAVGYAPWVEEIWTNYISNALKYGGTPPIVELGAKSLRNGMVQFFVKDNGRGLNAEEQQRVFTPFTRLDQVKVEGHGLGLSIVQRIVHKLGGQIGVESVVGKGSKFTFTLPSAKPSAHKKRSNPTS